MLIDPRIDAYIDRAAPFARPILRHLRVIIAAACPDGEETIKWGFPHFLYGGRLLCSMAAFKAHASFGFWQGEQVIGDHMSDKARNAMGQFGRLEKLSDLPDDALLRKMLATAMALNKSGAAPKRPVKHPKAPLAIPDDLAAALAAAPVAKACFDGFPPGQQREYAEWVASAKRAETRAKRLETTISQLTEGKRLNWKYERC